MNNNATNHHGVSVQVRGIRRSYGKQEVLKGIDLEVRPGEIFVIMGASGSGKSVLLRHIIGLETPDAGEILVNGESVHSSDVAGKYRMALVFQSGALLNSLTVGENVGLYLSEHRLKTPDEIRKIELDPVSAVVIGEEIHQLNKRIGVTSLVVSHDRDLAFGIADRIAVMHEGEIVALGAPDEVKRSQHPIIRKFIHADFKRQP